MRMKLPWLANTRPDCQFEISQLEQVTNERFDKEIPSLIRRLNKATNYAVKIPALDHDSVRVVGFADASFANNLYLSSQLGHIFFLVDKDNRAAPVSFKSYNA